MTREERAKEWAKACGSENDPVFSKPGAPKRILDAALKLWAGSDMALDKAVAEAKATAESLAKVQANRHEIESERQMLDEAKIELEAKVAAATAEAESLRASAGASGEVSAKELAAAKAKVAELDSIELAKRVEIESLKGEVERLKASHLQISGELEAAAEKAAADFEKQAEKLRVAELKAAAGSNLFKAARGCVAAAKQRGTAMTSGETSLEDAVADFLAATAQKA